MAVVRLEQVMSILTSKNSLFRDKYVTCLAEENLSMMEWSGQDHVVRKVMLQSTHIMLSGNAKTISWCLGKKHASPAEYVAEFKSLKPCVIGSDAHEIKKIGAGPNGKYTWVKADPTFNGLRQMLYEPESRVFIGSTAPDEKDATKVIKSISIAGVKSDWLADQTIVLNRDLVAVIGGKGSGKTALADLLGYAGGDFDTANENTFLNKAREFFEDATVKLEWEIGPEDEQWVIHKTSPAEQRVRYLSQSFVESLCSHNQHAHLIEQIEGILYQYVPKTSKMGAPDFAGLKDLKTKAVQREILKIKQNIAVLNKEITALEDELGKTPALEKDLERLKREKEELEKQKPAVTTAAAQQEQEALQKLRAEKATLEHTIETLRIVLGEIEEFRTRARLLKGDIEQFNSDVRPKLKAWGLTEKIDSLTIQFPLDLETAVSERTEMLQKAIIAAEGSPGAVGPNVATISSFDHQIAAIEAKSSLEAQQKAKLAEFGRRLADYTASIERLEKTIGDLKSSKPAEHASKVERRNAEYQSFFTKLGEKKTILEELYKPLNDSSSGGAERSKVEFYARFSFDLPKFIAAWRSIFDGRKMLVRRDLEMIEHAQTLWRELSTMMPNVTIAPAVSLQGKLAIPEKPIAAQLVGNFGMKEFYDWIYGVDFFDVEYGIKYEKVDLDKLSPGRKGVVLMMIYLDVDRDYRPLIIDQPEENLDNRSVYSTLVEYFRQAKKKRQIILVTHNANLVVNADAEQIVVANFDLELEGQDKVIDYVSGSLEFSQKRVEGGDRLLERQGTREHVCEILEGGDEAFQRRESKYGLVKR